MAVKVDLDLIVARCHDLLERIHSRGRKPTEIEFELYNVVALKLYGYAVNTFKSIYYLIRHEVYEQATVLYRSLWETGVNIAWISLDPKKRALRFLEFTAVEHRKFIEGRIREARAENDEDAILALTRQQADLETELDSQLSVFSYSDSRGRKRWRDRYSALTVRDLAHEAGGSWAKEYDRDYALGSSYTHGAPAAVLFPLFDPDGQLDWERSSERAGIVGAMSIEAMSRIYRSWLASRDENDDAFLADLWHRVQEASGP